MCQIGNILSVIGKKKIFGIGNGPEFRPQNRVIESPACFSVNMVFWLYVNKKWSRPACADEQADQHHFSSLPT